MWSKILKIDSVGRYYSRICWQSDRFARIIGIHKEMTGLYLMVIVSATKDEIGMILSGRSVGD
jgi:hypothetical protein